MKKKILLTRSFQKKPIEILKKDFDLEIGGNKKNLGKEEIINKIKDKQALICLLADTIDKQVIDAAPELKIIANYAVGYNNIDVDYCIKKNIIVTNTPDVLNEATADIAFALLLSVARRLIESHVFVLKDRFKGWEPNLMLGKEIYGKRVGIIGMGRIGKAFARRCKGFGLETVYYSRTKLKMEEENKFNVKYLNLNDLLKTSDFVSIHVPLTDETYHLLNRKKLNLMKRSSVLINTARGPVVDEKVLLEMLKNKKIWGAGFDVYEDEPDVPEKLKKLDNVVLLPHIGSATEETRTKMAMMCVNAVKDFFEGKTPENIVPEWKNNLKNK